MEIRVWQSFSCNNSSSYRLVARFADPKAMHVAEAELNALFKEHAKQFDAKFEETEDYPREPTEAAAAFAKRNGFEWKKMMVWGDEMLEGDEPELASEGNVLVLYHSYCGGGLPPEVNTYLAKRGATIDKPKRGAPEEDLGLTAVFKLPSDAKKAKALQRLLEKTFRGDGEEEEEEEEEEEDDDDYETEIEVPWATLRSRGGRRRYGKAAYFSDGKTAAFYYALIPADIALLKTWLADKGARDVRLRLCETTDFKKFRAIAKALKKCPECGTSKPLEYLDPSEHNLESEQLACGECGGMFSLATFMAKKKKKPIPAKKMVVEAKPKPKPKKKKAAAKTPSKKKTTKKKAAAKRK